MVTPRAPGSSAGIVAMLFQADPAATPAQITLVSPVAWEHHWVWVVPLLILLGERTVRLRSVFWGVTTVVVALAFGLRLLYWYVPVDDAADLRLGLPQQLAADCFPLVGLAILVVLAVIATRRPPVRPAVAP